MSKSEICRIIPPHFNISLLIVFLEELDDDLDEVEGNFDNFHVPPITESDLSPTLG